MKIFEVPVNEGKYHIAMFIDLDDDQLPGFIERNRDKLSDLIEETENRVGIENVSGYAAIITDYGLREEKYNDSDHYEKPKRLSIAININLYVDKDKQNDFTEELECLLIKYAGDLWSYDYKVQKTGMI